MNNLRGTIQEEEKKKKTKKKPSTTTRGARSSRVLFKGVQRPRPVDEKRNKLRQAMDGICKMSRNMSEGENEAARREHLCTNSGAPTWMLQNSDKHTFDFFFFFGT